MKGSRKLQIQMMHCIMFVSITLFFLLITIRKIKVAINNNIKNGKGANIPLTGIQVFKYELNLDPGLQSYADRMQVVPFSLTS